MSLIHTAPKHHLIEKVAGELAAVFYEIGRGQGMTSIHKTPRAYARANLEKFIPNAVDHLLDMLGRKDINDLCKKEIYEAIMERNNDPTLKMAFPDIDVSKIMETKKPTSILVNTKRFEGF